MTTTPARQPAAALDLAHLAVVVERLEHGFPGGQASLPGLANQYLLDAIDRQDTQRFLVWPPHDPVGVAYAGPSGTVVPAGLPEAAAALAPLLERVNWRVLIGDAAIADALLALMPRTFLRRRPQAREQRFMVADPALVPAVVEVPGFRIAQSRDVERLTDFACLLHVEDHMGPPITRAGRGGVRARVIDTIGRHASWVVDRDGEVVAKFDLSVHSLRRGAQIAGVYVDRRWRGQGIASAAVCALTRQLLDEGMVGVTLHVRSDNARALAAYQRAGFRDHGPWTLALR
jgi:uncharacterized protein